MYSIQSRCNGFFKSQGQVKKISSGSHALKQVLNPLKRPIYWTERQLFSAGFFSLDSLTLPHFLGLGAPQAGSTWLYVNLSQHPDVFLSGKKETHYFTRHFHKWPLRYYASLFEEGADKVRGEITPGYNLLRLDRIRYIRKILPDARLILIIRNPVDRAWSSFRREGARVAKSTGIEFENIDESKARKYFQRHRTAEWGRAWDYEQGLSHEHYIEQIDRWTSIYPEEQLFVGFFDELKNDPKALMMKVCRHIGVRTDIDWDSMPLAKVVNKNPEHAIPDHFLEYLKELYSEEIERLYDRFGEPVATWR